MEFRIGDRVKSREKGEGTVISLDGHNIGVEYDKYFGGHSCSSAKNGKSGKDGYCWWELKDDIKKIGGNMKFKVGDKVRIKNNLKDIVNFKGGYTDELEKYVGKIVKIKSFNSYHDGKSVEVEGNGWTWDIRALEKVEEIMTKKDLKTGDIVTLKNGDRLVLAKEEFYDLSGDSHWIDDLDDYNDDLTCDTRCYSEYDIIKVERAKEYETVFEREEVKELTVDEISEKLGYKVKVVGVDK